MAEHIWQSQDGDWSAPASWSSGAVPAGAAPATDTVLFTGASQQSVTSGLDNNAVDLVLLRIQPEYTGDIGNEHNPLKISADRVIHKGKGTLWYEDGAGVTDVMILNSPAGRGTIVLMGGNVGRAQIVQGKMICGSSMGTILKLGMSTRLASLRTHSGAGLINALFMADGQVVLSSSVFMDMHGGRVYITGNAPSITLWRQSGGITVDLSQGATLTNFLLLGGIYDTTQQIQGTRTITDAYIWPKGDFRYVEERITITNLHDMTGDDLTKAV